MSDFPTQGDMVLREGWPRSSGSDSKAERDAEEMRAWALETVAQLKPDFAERDKACEMIDNVIYLQNAVHIPKNYRKTSIEVRSPLPLHITNQITAALSINPPKVHFKAIKRGDPGQENKQLRQDFFEASWLRQQEEARRPLNRLFTHSVVTKGEGIIKVVERSKRAWSGQVAFSKKTRTALDGDQRLDEDSRDRLYDARTEEWKQSQGYPISATDVPPETFYYLRGEDGFSVCAEVKEIPFYDALTRYGASLDGKGRVVPEALGLPRAEWVQRMDGARMLKMTEVWDWERAVYVLSGPGDMPPTGSRKTGEGLTVKVVKHKYGNKDLKTLRGPYFHCHGITTSSRRIEFQGLGVLSGYLSLFPMLDSLLTIQTNAAYLTGFPIFKRTTPPAMGLPEGGYAVDASEVDANEEVIEPGAILPYDLAPVDQPRGGVELDKVVALVRGLIEMALPSVAQGMVSGEMAGYAINQAAHLASLAWDPIISNIEQLHADRVAFESWLIGERIREPVYVHGLEERGIGNRRRTSEWMKIGPTDLQGYHRYGVELEPKTPVNRTLEVRMHEQLLAMGGETRAQMIEGVGNDPIEVERGRQIEALKSAPEMQKIFQARVMKAVATLDQQEMAEAESKQPQMPPEQMPPPAPPGQQITMEPPPGAQGPQQGGPPLPPQELMPQPPGVPGVPQGAPAGVRNAPTGHIPLPGEGG